MTRERAEELLAEKGMWLIRIRDDHWSVWHETPIGSVAEVASGSTWREAASNALGIPAF